MQNLEHQKHEFGPVYDENSEILILGSFPSVKSREQGFYYGHPMNRFWKLLAKLYQCEVPVTIDQKREMLLKNHIALWDVIESCDIAGSADSSITNVVVNDFERILADSQIQRIYANGNTALKLYQKYVEKDTKIKAIGLPSTSPANAAYSLDRLFVKWQERMR